MFFLFISNFIIFWGRKRQRSFVSNEPVQCHFLIWIIQQDISLRTVLLLSIFAAVDIAASAGFVMVRVIMVSKSFLWLLFSVPLFISSFFLFLFHFQLWPINDRACLCVCHINNNKILGTKLSNIMSVWEFPYGIYLFLIQQYLMRDHYFPRDMRMPIHSIEYNQLAAYVSLRLVSMKVRELNFLHFFQNQSFNCSLFLSHFFQYLTKLFDIRNKNWTENQTWKHGPIITVQYWCNRYIRFCDCYIFDFIKSLFGHLCRFILSSS